MKILGSLSLVIFAGMVHAQPSGGPYQLEKTVVANGGGTSSGGSYSLVGTVGQAVAGGPAATSPYRVYSGFWTPSLAPTAASVTVSGYVRDQVGRGISGAVILLTDMQGVSQVIQTNTSGSFRFADVAAGESYIVSVAARRYMFVESQFLISVVDSVTDLNFVAR